MDEYEVDEVEEEDVNVVDDHHDDDCEVNVFKRDGR